MDLKDLLIFVLIVSNLASLFFVFRKRRARPESYEVKDLMQDLLSGSALIQVKRVAPMDVFIRSPRDL